MNRDDIIRMAREAGAAAEREKVARWMIKHSYATGHGDTMEDLLKELEWQINERINACFCFHLQKPSEQGGRYD